MKAIQLWIIFCSFSQLFPSCDTAYCYSTWYHLSSSCRLADDAVARLSRALEEELAGQTLAARAIEKAVARNIQKHETKPATIWNDMTSAAERAVDIVKGFPHSIEHRIDKRSQAAKMRPLFMHFSGPTGACIQAKP
jgi:hypothetical protein